jgi:hypothetical protein
VSDAEPLIGHAENDLGANHPAKIIDAGMVAAHDTRDA